MITVKERGIYRLIQTKNSIKILILDGKDTYAWVEDQGASELLITSPKTHTHCCVLAIGNYRFYEVKDEPKLSDGFHLELYVGCDSWQGYLLPNGLPTGRKKKQSIFPTKELITNATALTCLPSCVCHEQK